MKKALMNGLLATAFLSPFVAAEDAEAREYCREYTKSIRIDGRLRTGYGQACEQPDGSWMIVKSRGDVDPFEPLRARNVAIVAQSEPVYFAYGPYYRPRAYYAPVRYYYNSPGFYFGYGAGFHDNGRHNGWRNHDRRENHHGHDHDGDDDHDHDHHRRH